MLRKVFIFLAICSSIVLALEWPNPWESDGMAFSSAMDIPLDPTFYKAMAIDSWMPSGGAQIFMVSPGRPMDLAVDTGWTGDVTPHFILDPSEGIDSAFCEDMFTGLPISTIHCSDEMGMVFIRATGEGYFAVRATDTAGEMKSSLPILFDVRPSGDTATSWGIFGENRIIQTNTFDLHWAAVTDDSGRVVPSFLPGITMDIATARVVYESNPDSSAGITNPFTMTPLPEATISTIYSMAPFYIYDTESETLKIVAFSASDTLAVSDTFTVFVLPADDAAFLLPIRFDGMRVTNQLQTNIYGMAFDGSEPDPSNNSTKVRMSAIDLTGSESVEIEPDDWRKLTGGFAGFTFLDSEPDTLCVYLIAETDSVPELIVPFYTPIQVVPPTTAVKFSFRGSNIVVTGDTSKLVIEGVTGYGEIDTMLDAWFTAPFYGDEDSSATIIDSATGTSWHVSQAEETALHMTDGRYVLYLTDSEAETLTFEAKDAELVGLFDQGLIGFFWEHEVVFEDGDSGGALTYNFEPTGMGIYPTLEIVELTITARTSAGTIDAFYDGSAAVTASGFATTEPSGGIVDFVNGIATIGVRNDSSETIELEISGPLIPDNMMLMFIDAVSGGILFPFFYEEWMPVGTERTVIAGIMNLDGVAVTYEGVATVSVFDPDDNGSISAPDSIVISGGLGDFEISDIDAERFTLRIDAGGDEGYFEIPIESRALTNAILPCGCEVGAALDSIVFSVTDTAYNLYPYSCTLEIEIGESNPNASVSYNEEVYISDGYGIAIIENTEAETLDVYISIPENQYAYMESTLVSEWTYYIGEIVYIACAIGEGRLPERFDVGPVVPNPFNSAFSVDISLPNDSDFEIRIFDIGGHKILDRVFNEYPAGRHGVVIHLDEQPSGLYWITVSHGDNLITRKAVLLK